MTNAIKVLLQRQSGFLQLGSTLNLTHVGATGPKYALKSSLFLNFTYFVE
jgi:hypothetical protein